MPPGKHPALLNGFPTPPFAQILAPSHLVSGAPVTETYRNNDQQRFSSKGFLAGSQLILHHLPCASCHSQLEKVSATWERTDNAVPYPAHSPGPGHNEIHFLLSMPLPLCTVRRVLASQHPCKTLPHFTLCKTHLPHCWIWHNLGLFRPHLAASQTARDPSVAPSS